MPTYRYKARTSDGQPTNGVITTESVDEAHTRLTNRGFSDIDLVEARLPDPNADIIIPKRPPARWPWVLLVILVVLVGLALAAWQLDLIPADLRDAFERFIGLKPASPSPSP